MLGADDSTRAAAQPMTTISIEMSYWTLRICGTTTSMHEAHSRRFLSLLAVPKRSLRIIRKPMSKCMYLVALLLASSAFSSLFDVVCLRYSGRIIGRKCALNDEIIGIDLSNPDLVLLPTEIFSQALLFFPWKGFCECVALDRLCRNFIARWVLPLNSTKIIQNSTIRVWEHQLNYCLAFGRGHICPANSGCVFNGPDCFNCLCNSNHWGYRCLRQGTFPTITIFIAVLGVTFLCCLLLFYRFFAPWTVVYQALELRCLRLQCGLPGPSSNCILMFTSPKK
ncbi:All-tran retinoic acid-induced differentiation factor [Taenia crassiceps]|uniref:All-tran retinoic acid-induced differentiation factor n=1 Tax=Taenia crassiceps TaxID=6207 RepID=A0ABR4Q0L1_9CEST